MVDDGLLLCNLKFENFMLSPFLVTFNIAHYEDPFLCTPSPNENAKSFVKMMMSMGIGSVEKIGAKRDKVFDACVFWHDICFHCMTIKPFNGIGMLYGLFVKNFASNGVVWDDIMKKCLDLCAPTSSAYVLGLFEYWHEGYLDELDVFCYEDNNWDMDKFSLSIQSRVACYEDPYLKHSNLVDHILVFENVYLHEGLPLLIARRGRGSIFGNVMHWLLLGFYCTSIKPFNGVGIFYGNLVKNFSSYEFVLGYEVKECMNLCSHTSSVLVVSMIEHEYGDWALGYEHKHAHLLGVEPSFGDSNDPNPSHHTMILDLLLLNLVGVRNQDLRTNPFQEGEDDTIMDAMHQRIHSRREPWIDWGPIRGKSMTRS